MNTAALFIPGQQPVVLALGALPPKPLALFFRKAKGSQTPNAWQ